MNLEDIILLVLLGSAAVLNYLRHRDPMYPAFIHATCWSGIFTLYFLHGGVVFPLSTLLYIIVVSSVILFSTGCYVATRDHTPSRRPIRGIDFEPKQWYMQLLVWIPIVGIVPFILAAFVLAQEGPFETFYRNLRSVVIDPERASAGGVWGIWAYLIPISFVSIAVQILLERYRTHAFTFCASLLVAFVYALFVTGRSFVMVLIIMSTGILLMTRRVSVLKTLSLTITIALGTFIVLGVLVGKGGSAEYGFQVDPENLWQIFVVYSLGSLPAFDAYLQLNLDWAWGEHIFRSFFALLAELGFEVEVRPLIQEYALVPFPTNVYTVFQPYYADFGFAGVILAPFGLGYLHGILYRKATSGHLFSLVLFAFLLYPLVFQFFQDQYFSLLSSWVQYFFLLFLFFYRVRVLRPDFSGAMSSGGILPNVSE